MSSFISLGRLNASNVSGEKWRKHRCGFFGCMSISNFPLISPFLVTWKAVYAYITPLVSLGLKITPKSSTMWHYCGFLTPESQRVNSGRASAQGTKQRIYVINPACIALVKKMAAPVGGNIYHIIYITTVNEYNNFS